MKGNLIIISSPSGGGKGTLIREILPTIPDLAYSVSYTTRGIRPGEIDGVHYNFISKEDFAKRIEQDEFLEYAEVHGNYYGTSRLQTVAKTEAGNDVILEIDVQGAEIVMKKMPQAITIFILPPSFAVLRERLIGRATERAAELTLRLENSFEEVSRVEQYQYVVINQEVKRAVADLTSIILGERQKRVRQTDLIESILSSFDVKIASNLENL